MNKTKVIILNNEKDSRCPDILLRSGDYLSTGFLFMLVFVVISAIPQSLDGLLAIRSIEIGFAIIYATTKAIILSELTFQYWFYRFFRKGKTW